MTPRKTHPRPVCPPNTVPPLRGFGPAHPYDMGPGQNQDGSPLRGFEAARLKAITCPKCNGKRNLDGRCSDCGFGEDCCRALDAALGPRDEPNLVVPLLLSLNGDSK